MLRKPEIKLEITGGREVLRLFWRARKSYWEKWRAESKNLEYALNCFLSNPNYRRKGGEGIC